MAESTSITRHDGHGHTTTTTTKKAGGITATELLVAAAVLGVGIYVYEKYIKPSGGPGNVSGNGGLGGLADNAAGVPTNNGLSEVLNDGSDWGPTSTTADVPNVTPSSNTYTVVSGDYPAGIAKKFTGDATRYPELFAANPDKALVDCYSVTDSSGSKPICIPKGTSIADAAPGIPTAYTSTNFASFNPGLVLTLPASWPATPTH